QLSPQSAYVHHREKVTPPLLRMHTYVHTSVRHWQRFYLWLDVCISRNLAAISDQQALDCTHRFQQTASQATEQQSSSTRSTCFHVREAASELLRHLECRQSRHGFRVGRNWYPSCSFGGKTLDLHEGHAQVNIQ